MVELVKTAQVLPLRNTILRNNAGIEASRFAEDDFPGTFHLGYFLENDLASIVTFLPKDLPEGGLNGIQLRGMATATEFAGRGYGAALVNFAVAYLKDKDTRYIWCNARVSAAGFYEKFGFKIISEAFEVPNIGLHYRMLLFLTNSSSNN